MQLADGHGLRAGGPLSSSCAQTRRCGECEPGVQHPWGRGRWNSPEQTSYVKAEAGAGSTRHLQGLQRAGEGFNATSCSLSATSGMHTHICAYTRVHMIAHQHVRTQTHMCALCPHTCMREHVCYHVCTRMQPCSCMCTHDRRCVFVYVRSHAHMHTRTHHSFVSPPGTGASHPHHRSSAAWENLPVALPASLAQRL